MYLSPVVRTLRDDPVPGERVTLLLSLADEHADDTAAVEADIEETVSEAGGTVEEKLQFNTIAVTIPHEGIPALCELDGVASIETDETIGITPGDAGEDLDGLDSPGDTERTED
ncbi:hypothetical protein ACFR9U_00375 [Halorientalis brevis]|uniref:Putative peptidase inhibitor domain-containing protein n=1 Tax=Halorientalis brevis TaxID=1126241 RepID=A0ABD6C5G2_9EURY|nr:hypothetical protein [Halorientalis brevis]